MRLACLVSLALVFSVPAPAVAQEWIEFVDREERFCTNFPGQPSIEDITYLSEYGATLKGRVYTAEQGPNRYAVTVINYTGQQVTDVRGSIAYAAWNIRKRGGEITFDAYAQIDRIEGHQLQVNNPDQTRSYYGIHLHASRLYIIEATVPLRSPPPALFQVAMSILDEEGRRVRYNLDADGVRTPAGPDREQRCE